MAFSDRKPRRRCKISENSLMRDLRGILE
jgi:hypothetical protein